MQIGQILNLRMPIQGSYLITYNYHVATYTSSIAKKK